MSELPQKDFYKLSEVCQYTDTQPYVLRFWESEFPQLKPGRGSSGQRVYRQADIDLVLRIKQLLYEEQCTIASARSRLEQERSRPRSKVRGSARRRGTMAPRGVERMSDGSPQRTDLRRQAAGPPDPTPEIETVPRQRYEDAVDEIGRLRFELQQAEKNARKSEVALAELEQSVARHRARAESVAQRLDRLLDSLG